MTFYQLGAVLHDMIMRRPMFHDVQAPAAQVIDAVRHRSPEVDAPDIDQYLVSLARRCLEKDWRLRLHLVKWQEFQAPLSAETALTVKERIRMRIDAAGARPILRPEDSLPPRRRVLEQIGASIAAKVRRACRDSGLFPPVEVRHEARDETGYIFVKAGPSQSPYLDAALEVCFATRTLNPAGDAAGCQGLRHVRRVAWGRS